MSRGARVVAVALAVSSAVGAVRYCRCRYCMGDCRNFTIIVVTIACQVNKLVRPRDRGPSHCDFGVDAVCRADAKVETRELLSY